MTFANFDALVRPQTPNTWLFAPICTSFSDTRCDIAPDFDLPAEQLSSAWAGVISSQPRTRILAVSEDGLQIEAEQRSAVFGFVDQISFRAVPVGRDRSTLFAYSRSETGYWDLGVNRRRLRAWLATLEAPVRSVEQDDQGPLSE